MFSEEEENEKRDKRVRVDKIRVRVVGNGEG